ncbi:GDYXXLXY domain-containing protein [Mangrovivirga sp. M17]|uniref:GDYXXLXY domain-containing protein n=1 Tax=Mangrovivirga halotolerans TaxID=2993936 RepID=A0ABT3RUA2_9BACT|nr:GDYXXLXY domain-containing protein [Mangrovivirga halotolerans]MCX2745354.1 GDYXXLXY domain-containing protein [Mangrovivirga halotolerans]
MKNKKILLPLFILVCLIQLYIPAKMIMDREEVLSEGQTYKFRTQPIDPTDPFRGKYIVLNYEANSVEIDTSDQWIYGDQIFVTLTENEEGFTVPDKVFKEKPGSGETFITAKIGGTQPYNKPPILIIDYPFNKFFMEESMAPVAETVHRESQQDSLVDSYSIVKVLNGEAVLDDVVIGDRSIREIVKERQDQSNNSN